MQGIVLERHDSSPNAAAGHHFVAGLQLAQHRLPFFLAALLRHDEHEIKDGEDQDEGRYANPTRGPTRLQ